MLETLPRPKIRDVVAERLKSYILSEKLGPGDRLPTETELASRFGVSRLSLREATKALEFIGIIESKPGVGLTVGRIDLGRMTGHLGFHTALLGGSAEQLIDTRIIVETGSLPYAAQRMAENPALYQNLQSIIGRFRATRDLQDWISLDIEFHRTLLDASGLSPLVAFGDLLQIFFQRFRDSVKKAEWKAGIDSHQRIIDDLKSQNVTRAAAELRRHIESHKDRLDSAM